METAISGPPGAVFVIFFPSNIGVFIPGNRAPVKAIAGTRKA